MKLKMTQINEDTFRVHGLEIQYCRNVQTIHYNLQIQCNPYQDLNGIFFSFFAEREKNNPKIHNLNNQDKFEKENKNSDLRIPGINTH